VAPLVVLHPSLQPRRRRRLGRWPNSRGREW
jgi:hypothetical protein